MRRPLRAARMLCGCHPVILPSSAMLAPRRRCSWARHFEIFVFVRDPRRGFDLFGRSVGLAAPFALRVMDYPPGFRRHTDHGAPTPMAPPAMPVGAGDQRAWFLSASHPPCTLAMARKSSGFWSVDPSKLEAALMWPSNAPSPETGAGVGSNPGQDLVKSLQFVALFDGLIKLVAGARNRLNLLLRADGLAARG